LLVQATLILHVLGIRGTWRGTSLRMRWHGGRVRLGPRVHQGHDMCCCARSLDGEDPPGTPARPPAAESGALSTVCGISAPP
jgi:hypothetical protein